MSKKIICENNQLEKITFTYDFPFFLDSVEGLHEVIGSVSTVASAYSVGEQYIDTSVEKRPITITGLIKDNILERRKFLYKMFPLKTTGTLYYYEEDFSAKIDYKVETVKVADKGYPRAFQISLVCPNPYFTDINSTIIYMANWIPTFRFPLRIPSPQGIKFGVKNNTLIASIYNDTNIESGMKITFAAKDRVVNPLLFNIDSREELKVETEMQAGDKIVIYTYRQNTNLYFILGTTGKSENINNLAAYDSVFLQVHLGQNTFRHDAEEGLDSLETTIEYSREYEAV